MANQKPVGVAFSDPALVAGTTITGATISGGTISGATISGTTFTSTTGEIPSGTMNGVNKTFTIAHTPTSGITLIYNNATQFYGTDYTLSGTTITLGAGVTAPNTANGDTLYVLPYTY